MERLGVILEKTSLPFESRAVLNPAIFQEGEKTHMFYRAVDFDGISSIGYCELKDGISPFNRMKEPLIKPEFDYERKGIEDPRVAKIDDTYYLTYAAYDGKNARIAYATSKDLKKFTKHGIISPNFSYKEAEQYLQKSKLKEDYYFFSSYIRERQGEDCIVWEKDPALFPVKFDGKFALIHRILPEMQVVLFDDFKQLKDDNFWKSYLSNLNKHVIVENTEWFETRNIGGGCPPIETAAGWLLIYHGVHETNEKRTYSVGAAFLDKDEPWKLVAKSKEPLLFPETDWELSGDVKSTIFPTGSAIFGNNLYIYYGAADERIAVAKVELDNLIRNIIKDGLPR